MKTNRYIIEANSEKDNLTFAFNTNLMYNNGVFGSSVYNEIKQNHKDFYKRAFNGASISVYEPNNLEIPLRQFNI